MTLCPFAVYRPVVNHGGQMASHLGLVLHVQVGTGSLYNYFNNPASQVSAHFWCGVGGVLEQYVDCDVQAWAEAAGNPYYISVETEGTPDQPLTAAQIATLARLLDWLHAVYPIPLIGPVAHGQPGFTPHCNPDGTPDPNWGNHTCPGTIRLGQMGDILAATHQTDQKEEDMTAVVLPNGQVKLYAVGAGSRAGHLLEFTREATPTFNSVIDITDQIGGGDLYTVSP